MRFLLLTLVVVGLPVTALAESYTIDPMHSSVYFAINHLGFTTVYGRFDTFAGKVTVDWENGTGTVEVTVDAASVDTNVAKRDDHLRSPDFLNAVEFPKITYRSDQLTVRDGGTAGAAAGQLTLNGVTRPVALEVSHVHCGTNPLNHKDTCGFDAAARLMRSDFGIKYGLPGLGDEVTLMFGVEAIKD
jgi:polyisoprenoid-binding protein YceI